MRRGKLLATVRQISPEALGIINCKNLWIEDSIPSTLTHSTDIYQIVWKDLGDGRGRCKAVAAGG